MRALIDYIIDTLFPPTRETLELRTISHTDISRRLPKAHETPLPFIVSLFAYKNPLVKELIWNCKYHKNRHCLKLGGSALYQWLVEHTSGPIILIPIPISQKRRKERGYNQCELLVDEIVKLDQDHRFEKRYDILTRVKHTDRQTMKTRQDRLHDTDHIFNAVFIPLNNPIIIVDDVATTGSTLHEARRTLIDAGYTDVTALTLAH